MKSRFLILSLLVTVGAGWNSPVLGNVQATLAEWDSLDTQGLVQLATSLCVQGDSAIADRATLASYVESRILADEAVIKATPMKSLQTFVWALHRELRPAQQVDWAQKLRSAFANSADDIQRLDALEMLQFADIMWMVEDSAGRALLVDYVVDGTQWHECDLKTADRYMWHLRRMGLDAHDARIRLAGHLADYHLKNVDVSRSVDVSLWRNIVFHIYTDLSGEEASRWTGLLRKAFAPGSSGAPSLPLDQLQELRETLNWLGDPNADNVMRAATTAMAEVDTSDAMVLRKFMEAMGKEGRDAAPSQRELAAKITERFVAVAEKRALMWDESMVLARAYRRQLKREEARTAAQQAYAAAVGTEAARSKMSVYDLRQLGWLLSDLRMTGNREAYPGFASVIARLAEEGKLAGLMRLPTESEFLGRPLCSPEIRQLVIDKIADSKGNPRLGLVQALGWSYRTTDELDAWRAMLDAQVNREGANRDTRAQWLLARGCAESVSPRQYSPLVGLRYFKTALAAAESDSVRLMILDWICRGYGYIGNHDAALSYIDEVAPMMSDSPRELARLRDRVRAGKIRYKNKEARRKEQHQADVKAIHIEKLQERLHYAEIANDDEAIRRYQRLLQKVQ